MRLNYRCCNSKDMPRHRCFLLVSRFPSFLFMNSGTFGKKTRTLKHWQKPCIQIFFKLFQKTCSEDLYSASLKLVYHEKTHFLKRFDFGWSSYHQFIIKKSQKIQAKNWVLSSLLCKLSSCWKVTIIATQNAFVLQHNKVNKPVPSL